MSAPEFRGLRPAALAALLGLFAAAPSGDVAAAEVFRYDFQGASGICQPALSSHAATLRARPLAFVNEGEATAFVTCTFRGDPRAGARGATKVLAHVGNVGTAVAAVSCTFVEGRQLGGQSNAVYRTKSTSVFGGSPGTALTWQPSEIAGGPELIYQAAVQCALGPGGALHYISVFYDEDIGS
ncbi:hypothetical protein [Luteimonas sp. MC1572]|uniref:hypothetical protein n=1 Tax=Luteimonas sp. MC1572 TaxID=2799325 RepID=UPI0018F0BF14|nr:hypothetical protein [Luteimonas sp. MC1572]MBJ6981488.1 hypothetical protein [Luteimonas sp. MC1572]QQO02792.1 hypothetical protein JGR64_11555 [Luteimonas sp. MC1572]